MLQFNNRSQSLARGIQTGSRKDENQHTDNNAWETRRLANKGHEGNPKTHAGILHSGRQRTGRQQPSQTS